jgi:molybdenum cofactor synthesis domain-containing protein
MMPLARVRAEPLDLQEVIAAVTRPEAGAIATFAGAVRNHSMGQPVTKLEYEAYAGMAEKEMARIMQGICSEMPDVYLAAIHRVGPLQVGDLAVICAASAPHRGEALRVCELLIDRIKESVPIWKREHGPDGPYWVGWQDARCASHEHPHCMHGTGDNAELEPARGDGAQSGGSSASLAGLRVAVLTVSDTRRVSNDHSGKLAQSLLLGAGAKLVDNALVADEPERIRERLLAWANESLDAIVITGGTGIAPRDQTIEAVRPLLDRVIDGFGETFRRLSFDEVGTRAVLSRAMAGTLGTTLVAVLPGSPSAVRLGVRELVIPVLPHAAAMLKGSPGHHHAPEQETTP